MSNSLNNKVCIITGATSGIGKYTALQLAKQGWIIGIVCRNTELGKINFDNLQGGGKYSWAQSYSQSKLANLLFAYELSELLQRDRISVLAFHPGLTQSKLGRNLTGIFRYVPLILAPFMQKPEKAATFLTQFLDLPYSSVPRYFIKNKLSRSSQHSYDKELSSKLWAVSETLTQELK